MATSRHQNNFPGFISITVDKIEPTGDHKSESPENINNTDIFDYDTDDP